MSETPDGLRARLGALYEIDKRQWWTYARGSRSAFENRVREAWPTIDAMLARLATAEADAEAGWKWAWSFDQWTEHGATGSLTDEARAEFQRDLAAHENREQP
jgi:hypothetical protein